MVNCIRNKVAKRHLNAILLIPPRLFLKQDNHIFMGNLLGAVFGYFLHPYISNNLTYTRIYHRVAKLSSCFLKKIK